ncbi:MAG: hypothetical protein ACK55Z_34385, partial [bacterium]
PTQRLAHRARRAHLRSSLLRAPKEIAQDVLPGNTLIQQQQLHQPRAASASQERFLRMQERQHI